MHSAFTRTAHRPWSVPSQRWTWRQSWRDLLFIHWPVPTPLLKPLVPHGLRIQEFDGTSWIGVVPFRMAGVAPRLLPDVPGLSAFPELNVRLYVEAEGKPGVWFLSLDATSPIAVWAARRFFYLPYHRASMSIQEHDGEYWYDSQRISGPAHFRARYRPIGEVFEAAPGTLEHWLTERYCLYALSPNGTLLRNNVHHQPWPLQRAEASIEQNSMLDHWGLPHGARPLLHFSKRIDVALWDAERVGA
jgi:uncharacterized protein